MAISCTLEAKVTAERIYFIRAQSEQVQMAGTSQEMEKEEQIGSTIPMGKSLPQNISFTGSALIWKKKCSTQT